ncbi:Pimeloyl-ACP methyl ester carboxylesterase [Stigmatella erecta]|uniref:Pimeloyl-ACP methyl ester carboxylesterase n=2 Tax=Stigmatella erecta TaxID=83460 RepID=A0A1I0KK72_9BACT|nr:Pimeloyl-ACP methyl ester carboxylesterase [Stigmatella erecta]
MAFSSCCWGRHPSSRLMRVELALSTAGSPGRRAPLALREEGGVEPFARRAGNRSGMDGGRSGTVAPHRHRPLWLAMLLHHQRLMCSPSAEWIVFFHGMGGDCSIFSRQLPAFRARYNLLLIDLPGHGRSASLQGQEPLDFSVWKVLELLDHLRIPCAHFMGVSLGTLVMQAVALLAPGRIQSMVLAGATCRFLPWGEWLVKTSQAAPLVHLVPSRAAYILFAYILLPRRNHRTSRAMFIRAARALRPADYRAWVSVVHDMDRPYRQLAQRPNTLPKLYISGGEDHMFLPATRRFVENEARASLVVLPECGHVCHIEQASRFNALALAFLRRHAAPRAREPSPLPA